MIKNIFSSSKQPAPAKKSEKVFCVGLGKTGTTTLELALKEFGYRLGDQNTGEMFLKDYAQRNFRPIIDFCHTADAFQDAPFCYPYTYILLDHYFPEAKFILTVRDNAEQWRQSLIKFQAKLFGNGAAVCDKEALMKGFYLYEGRPWESSRILFNTPEDNIYDEQIMHGFYERHNASVRDYFRTKSNFLEINVAVPEDYERLCTFLGKEPVEGKGFSWLNKS
jgi:hypothetical protein